MNDLKPTGLDRLLAAVIVLGVFGFLVYFLGKWWAIGIIGIPIVIQQIYYRIQHGEWEKQIND